MGGIYLQEFVEALCLLRRANSLEQVGAGREAAWAALWAGYQEALRSGVSDEAATSSADDAFDELDTWLVQRYWGARARVTALALAAEESV